MLFDSDWSDCCCQTNLIIPGGRLPEADDNYIMKNYKHRYDLTDDDELAKVHEAKAAVGNLALAFVLTAYVFAGKGIKNLKQQKNTLLAVATIFQALLLHMLLCTRRSEERL